MYTVQLTEDQRALLLELIRNEIVLTENNTPVDTSMVKQLEELESLVD